MNKKLVSVIDELGPVMVAKVCGRSYQAVQKWRKKGSLPRTEWTGETDYAKRLEKASGGKYKASQLVPQVRVKAQAA